MDAWQRLFEQVVVPMTGLGLVVAAAVGAPVPVALYPILAGLIAYPAGRAIDRVRRNGARGNGS